MGLRLLRTFAVMDIRHTASLAAIKFLVRAALIALGNGDVLTYASTGSRHVYAGGKFAIVAVFSIFHDFSYFKVKRYKVELIKSAISSTMF